MKYIVRVDSGSTHCYNVRIGYKIKCRVNKSFADLKYGGKEKAFAAAKRWRNKQVKKLLPLMQEQYEYDQNGSRHWGEGVFEAWETKGEWMYLRIWAHYYDKSKLKQFKTSFSVNKHGYDEAIMLAQQWRKFKLTGELS